LEYAPCMTTADCATGFQCQRPGCTAACATDGNDAASQH
jgi:hypothetical protein